MSKLFLILFFLATTKSFAGECEVNQALVEFHVLSAENVKDGLCKVDIELTYYRANMLCPLTVADLLYTDKYIEAEDCSALVNREPRTGYPESSSPYNMILIKD